MEIFEISKEFPKEEKYSLTDQIVLTPYKLDRFIKRV
jgi:23S rRNA-intervening sequence protein